MPQLHFVPSQALRQLPAALGRAALAVLVTLALTALLAPFATRLSTATLQLLYLLPVLLSATVWGLGAGLVAALTGFLAYNYFFIHPYYTLGVNDPQDLLTLLIFLITGLLISQLIGRARASEVSAQARAGESAQMAEMITTLSGQRSPLELAQLLAGQTQRGLNADYVELWSAPNVEAAAFLAAAPPETSRPTAAPQVILPLQTHSHLLGELRLWMARPLNLDQQLRLQAFAAQGALALERATLAQAAHRARLLEESDQLKSALLSSVSHDLRTPLAAIKASVTSLLSEQVPWEHAARQDLLAAIDEETDHLNHLVGNLLAMSRIESGALRPNRQWNLLAEIVDGVLLRMRRSLDGYRLTLDVPDDLPLVAVDYVQMEQVFTNLLSNSIKYTPPGSTIGIRAWVEDDKQHLRVQVCNQGPPVPPEHLERIFDKFYRITDAERITGTGLGLSICKGIIQAHGGRIWAENLTAGCSFNFLLPLTWQGSPPPVVESAA